LDTADPDPVFIRPLYNPLLDAFCFNEDYPVPQFTTSQMMIMYNDYKIIFDKLLILPLPGQGVPENNNVTKERLPGVLLRMRLHDNTIDDTMDFRTYVATRLIRLPNSGRQRKLSCQPPVRMHLF
jgi:hypothetical protein